MSETVFPEDEGFEEDRDDDEYFDCGWTPHEGGCQYMGTDKCDEACPYNNDMMAQVEARNAQKEESD